MSVKPGTPPPIRPPFRLSHWLQDRLFRALIRVLKLLPYHIRIPLCGRIVSGVIAPLAGYRRRIRNNLALVMPDLSPAEVEKIVREVPDNAGRTLMEIYSGQEFLDRTSHLPLQGEGVAALEEAHREGRPVILVTAHFGNYDACRSALIGRGFPVGALYMNMANRYFNDHYLAAISLIGTPLFPRGREGLGAMVKFLRKGGMLALLIDQHMLRAPLLKFFGRDAQTALSAADLALKYNALCVPAYAVRLPDGLSFQPLIEAPIPHGDPLEMTQALNDSLERLVRKHPGQWFWIHKRWKLSTPRKRDAAQDGAED